MWIIQEVTMTLEYQNVSGVVAKMTKYFDMGKNNNKLKQDRLMHCTDQMKKYLEECNEIRRAFSVPPEAIRKQEPLTCTEAMILNNAIRFSDDKFFRQKIMGEFIPRPKQPWHIRVIQACRFLHYDIIYDMKRLLND